MHVYNWLFGINRKDAMSGNMCVTKYISILEVSTLTGFLWHLHFGVFSPSMDMKNVSERNLFWKAWNSKKKIIYSHFMVNNLFITKFFNFIKFFAISCKIYMYMYKGDVNFCVIYKAF